MNSPKPLAVFDVDGTLFKSSLLEKVTQHCLQAGLFDQSAFEEVNVLRRAWQLQNSEQSYILYIDTLIKDFVAQIEGVDVHVFDWITHKMVENHKVRLFAFPRQLMEAVRQTHALVIISGSPEIVVKPFVEQFKVDYIFGSKFTQKSGVYTGKGISVGDKSAILQRLVSDGKSQQEGSIAIGDTVSDISMLNFVETPIMFNASQTLLDHGRKQQWLSAHEVKDSITMLRFDSQTSSYREVYVSEFISSLPK